MHVWHGVAIIDWDHAGWFGYWLISPALVGVAWLANRVGCRWLDRIEAKPPRND